jgi:transcriptional regulatory protein LevR
MKFISMKRVKNFKNFRHILSNLSNPKHVLLSNEIPRSFCKMYIASETCSNNLVGFNNVHISCLIERLVKQNTLEDEIYFNETSEEFQKFQTYFKQQLPCQKKELDKSSSFYIIINVFNLMDWDVDTIINVYDYVKRA